MHRPNPRPNRILSLAITPLLLLPAAPALADRVYGIDVSQFQGSIDWPTVYSTGGKSFAFVRSSRGGTSGTYSGSTTTGLGRYDDPAFVTNINGATAAGLLASPYHFGRPDITTGSGFPANSTGVDEALHFLQIAGPWMKPGYLLPVLDLEAGGSERSTAALSQWITDFGNTIHAAKGIYPIVYTTSSYANDPAANSGRGEINSSVSSLLPNLWLARPDPSSDPANGDPLPALNYPNPYGVWNPSYPNTPNPAPWAFWQYGPSSPPGTVPGVPAAIDLDVAHGDLDYLKDFQVPALWKSGNGAWSTQSNWNTDADPNDIVTDAEDPSFYYPYHNDITRNGQAPAGRLPSANDNVVLDNSLTPSPYTVTLPFGTTASVRRLTNYQTLNVYGTLNVAKSITISGPTVFGGGAGTVNITESLTITPGASLACSVGSLTLGTPSTPATVTNAGTVTTSPTGGHLNVAANSTIANSGSMTLSGKINFGDNVSLTNTGTFTFSGFPSWGPGSSFTNSAGSATFNTDANPGSSVNLSITSANSPGITFNAKQHLASLIVLPAGHAALSPNGTHPLTTRALSLVGAGTLDLADNALVLDYDSTSPVNTIRLYLHNNRLTSTSADSTHRLAYLESAQLATARWSTPAWSLPDDTTLLITLALTGDANMDGSVNADDYALLDRAYARSLTNAHWTDGDFNYDGAVDASDYLLIDTTLGQAQGFSPGFLAQRESQFGAPYVSTLLSTIPEPSLLLSSILYLLPSSLLLSRRRRHTLKIRRTFQQFS